MQTPTPKEQFTLEYHLKSSIKILFPRLSTPIGLSEWFADSVTMLDDIYTFSWKNNTQRARLLSIKDMQYVRFRWLDTEDEGSEDSHDTYYFEFKVSQDDLTGDVHLAITDHAEVGEIEDFKELWDTQINDLKRLLGA